MLFFSKNSVKVRLVGNDLVAAFHSAQPPLVWKFDLERNHSFTVALQGEDGDWELGLNSTKGEFYPVAHFPLREDAEDALNKVQKILMKKRRSKIWGVLKFILILVFLALIVIVGGGYLIAHALPGMASAVMRTTPMGPMNAPAQMMAPPPVAPEPGVPQSADDVLKAPQ